MLIGAGQVIKLDPSSPLGYERKHQALCGAGHVNATDAFEMMLSKMSESPDPDIRGEGNPHYDIFPLIFSHRAISPLCSARTDKGSDSDRYTGRHSLFPTSPHQR